MVPSFDFANQKREQKIQNVLSEQTHTMPDFYSQPIQLFVKQNHPLYAAKALEEKDLRGFIRQVCFSILTRKGFAESGKTISSFISELSNNLWQPETVKREIAAMAKGGEFKRQGHKQINWNPVCANRVVNFKNNFGYKGLEFKLTDAQRELISTLNRIRNSMPYDAEDLKESGISYEEHMEKIDEIKKKHLKKETALKTALKKIDRLELKLEEMDREAKQRHKELLDILQGNSKPEEIVEKVKRHLEIVR